MKLSAKKIEQKTKYLKVNSFKSVGSTNVLARKMAALGCDEGTTVVATKQTAGKGRLGRTFLSKRGGVYFSIVLRPKESTDTSLFITVAAAVAAACAIEAVSNKKCQIKWVNDIYINSKKVCGILTEGCFNVDGSLDYAVLGVGVNLFKPKGGFPSNLPLADSIFKKKDKILRKTAKKEQFLAEFANIFFPFYNNLEKKDFITEYQNRSLLTGKKITYTKDGQNYCGTVNGIDNDARLIIEVDGKKEILSHGEIQIVGMEQLLV